MRGVQSRWVDARAAFRARFEMCSDHAQLSIPHPLCDREGHPRQEDVHNSKNLDICSKG